MGRADNPLVRTIGRIPATVQRKLLVALAMVAVLLVAVGVLGLIALDASNDRVETLGVLPQRAAGYEDLGIYSQQLYNDLFARDTFVIPCNYGAACPADQAPVLIGTDSDIIQTLDAISSAFAKVGSVPARDQRVLTRIHAEYLQVSVVTSFFSSDSAAPFHAQPFSSNLSQTMVASLLEVDAGQLVLNARSEATSLAVQNQASYLASQHLVIGVAAGSVVLALLVGLTLSWSLTGPIRKMDTRLAAIAAGDFSIHVDVTNRDELGALATNLNRMNDELGRLYQELENASKHKSEFLANMSHELRTPLNAVIGFSEVLEGRLFGELNEKQAEYVTDIHTSGRHLLTLINDILDLSKIEAGRMDLQVTPFLFADLVQNSVTLLRERATRQGTALGFEVSDNVGVVEADERMIKQVLFNLLTNALKFTPKGGHVDVSAHGDGGDVVVSVRDDGVGIAPADRERIFEEFQQVGASQPQEGTGLGLAISRRFVELHGGRLWVDSQPAHGSTFIFTIPRVQSSAPAPDTRGSADPTAVDIEMPTTGSPA
jgi:signal transduction histidine kinase